MLPSPPTRSCLFLHLPSASLDVVETEWVVNVRQDTAVLPASVWGGQARLPLTACMPSGAGSHRAYHLGGRRASGSCRRASSCQCYPDSPLLKMKVSWRQKEMAARPSHLLAFPSSSFVSISLFWRASGSQGQPLLACKRSREVALSESGGVMWVGGEQGVSSGPLEAAAITCLCSRCEDFAVLVSQLFEEQLFLG